MEIRRGGKALGVVATAILAAIVAVALVVSAEVEFPALAVSEEIAVGEQLLITLYAKGNVTLAVFSPTGPQFSDSLFWVENTTGSWALPTSQEWGFGKGRVEATISDLGNSTTLLRTFELLCTSTCLIEVMNSGVERAFRFVWVIAAIVFILGIMFVGHAAHVYRVDRGELSWAEHIILLTKTALKRDPFQRIWKDQTGALPEELRENLETMKETAKNLSEQEKEVKHADRYARLKAAEVLARSGRLEKAVLRIERVASDAEMRTGELRFAPTRRSKLRLQLISFLAVGYGFLGLGLTLSINAASGFPIEVLRGFLWEPWMAQIPDSFKIVGGILAIAPLLGYLLSRYKISQPTKSSSSAGDGVTEALNILGKGLAEDSQKPTGSKADTLNCDLCGKGPFSTKLKLNGHRLGAHRDRKRKQKGKGK